MRQVHKSELIFRKAFCVIGFELIEPPTDPSLLALTFKGQYELEEARPVVCQATLNNASEFLPHGAKGLFASCDAKVHPLNGGQSAGQAKRVPLGVKIECPLGCEQ
jgi:hypothetical protein